VIEHVLFSGDRSIDEHKWRGLADGGRPSARGARLFAGRIRELIEASVLTDGSVAELEAAAERIAAVTADLRARSRDLTLLLAPLGSAGRLSVHNPVEGSGNALAPPLTRTRVSGGTVRATATLGIAHEGAPGRAHGGWMAALLDHAVGRAVAAAGPPGMTVSLTVEYRHSTPYGVPLDIEVEVTGREGRKGYVVGRIRAEGRVTATASATLVTVSGLPVHDCVP
jgi:acyl-coenzyme A thioesterase PaaI-like protein